MLLEPVVGCAPDGSCTIVDGEDQTSTITVLADGSWTRAEQPGGPLVTDLWCAAAADCLGFNRNIGFTYSWDGATWITLADPATWQLSSKPPPAKAASSRRSIWSPRRRGSTAPVS